MILMPVGPKPEGVPDILRCSANPSDLTIRRQASLQNRPASIFAAPDATLGGDTMFHQGAGQTTLETKLLFVSPHANGDRPVDVRSLTEPLHRLSAPLRAAPGLLSDQDFQATIVEFIWGKHWAFRGTISDVAETVDFFEPNGAATRSWVSLRMMAVGGLESARRSAVVHG